jgi:two-component system OmpR family response regulator
MGHFTAEPPSSDCTAAAFTAISSKPHEPNPTRESQQSHSAPRRRILIAEDDQSLAGFLCSEFEAHNYVVDVVHDGEEALEAIQGKDRYDLLVLDLNLPKLDGIELIDRIRPANPRLPVLVLTARNSVEERVAAFQTGADDCLTKPFSLLELLARVQALLRRISGMVPNTSRVGDLTLNRDERRVERNGRRIDLTPREFSILDVMMRNPGHPVSRATLLEEVWNMSGEPSTNIVDVYMKYVRDKIDLPGEPRLTHTVRGFGYELRNA